MTFGEFKKSPAFVLTLLGLVLVMAPFGLEQIGDASGLFKFQATKWVKQLFHGSGPAAAKKQRKNADWNKKRQEVADFLRNITNLPEVTIFIVRHESFDIDRVDANTATRSTLSWKLTLKSNNGPLDLTETQVENRLLLIREPEDKVSCSLPVVVRKLPDGEQGFLVTVNDVSGEGTIGISYDGHPSPVYDVNRRRPWPVQIASCRVGVPGGYQSGVFIDGASEWLEEGGIIPPDGDRCGYRLLSVSERCAWFEIFCGAEPPEDVLPHGVWPDFSRVELEPQPRLVFRQKDYIYLGDDPFKCGGSFSLLINDFLSEGCVVFRLLEQEDADLQLVSELLCVIVREE